MKIFNGKKLWKAVSLGLCGAALTVILAGCGSENSSADKGVLKVGVTNFADTLEPTQNYFGWVVMRYGLGECLTKFDEKMNVQPWLAESWSISEDHLTWTFKIRDGVKFSNGDPLTAEAVKASIERTFAKNNRAATFFKYKEIKAEGQTLTIVTEKPMPNMPGFLADPLFIIVDTNAEGSRDFAKEGPICTGPYMVESFVKEKAVMKKNPNYWDGDVPFETVEVPSIDDPNTRAMALQSGEVDMAVNIAAGDMDTFRGNDKFDVDEISSLRVVLARLNQKGILKDDKVRAALICGCDRETYNNVLLKGTFLPGKAPVPPSMDYGFDQLTDPNAYNPERAAQLLDEAGWKDTDGDGIREKDGQPLKLDFVVYNSRAELPLYAEAVQADLKKLGFDINIKTVDYNLVDQMGIKGEYDLLISNITTANTGDPEIFLSWYWKTNHNGDNPQNGSGYSNPALDAKFNELAVEFDKSKRRQLMIDIQQIIMNDGAALFLGYPQTNIVSSKALAGVKMYPSDYYWITNLIKPNNK
ncbi:MAG: ABC transporter substrate-binding protein [Selenomonas sp.]|uniref:ABC transporter substrate-binding protein n=1 Tax=Selenomonas sp. TaxID=2053611 RepID=UPI0025D1BB09|nr:ABC transporter substrate-binding protein [Selenomonas sp.]MCR5758561.1 ABC transporter substrate-binding protein [Selenomonas sp.]